jgi:UDP-glucose 6-dehydrogenase
LGLAFKPDTDDLRDSPALDIACRLASKGAIVTAYDPMVTSLPDAPDIQILPGAYEAAAGVDVIVVATEWRQFLALDLPLLRKGMRGDLFLDGRNNFDPDTVQRAGFRYLGIGRRAALTSPGPRPFATPAPDDGVVSR